MPKKRCSIRGAGLIVFSIIVLASALYFLPRQRLAILSVDTVQIEPVGWEDPSTHEWKGSFWIVSALTNTQEAFLFRKFADTQSESQGITKLEGTVGGKTIIVKGEVTVTITPEKPYYERPVEVHSYNVYPKTCGVWMNKVTFAFGKLTDSAWVIPAFNVDTWQWGKGYWTRHTPFTIKIEKTKGANPFVKEIRVDTLGGVETIVIENPYDPSEKLMIQNLGQIGTGYGEPQLPEIVMFDEAHTMAKTNEVIQSIQYDAWDNSYSNYWFGGGNVYKAPTDIYINAQPVARWLEQDEFKGSPAHVFQWQPSIIRWDIVADEWFPGQVRQDDFWNYMAKPVPASQYEDKAAAGANPYGYSLWSYLIKKVGASQINLEDYTWHEGYVWDKTSNVLRIYLPYGSASSLITLKMSTELCDSFVYQPIVGKGTITSVYWFSSGSSSAEIGDRDLLIVKVRQDASAEAKLMVKPTVDSVLPFSINPTQQEAIISPGTEQTFNFEVKNLGTTDKKTGVVTVKVINDMGTVTDSKQLSFTLLPKGGAGNTMLTVWTLDKETAVKVSGVQVTVMYGTQSKSLVTSQGYCTFDLGTYQGNVRLATLETSEYKAASMEIAATPGQNTVYLNLVKKGSTPSLWDLLLEWLKQNSQIVIVAAMLTTIVAAIYAKSGTKHRRR